MPTSETVANRTRPGSGLKMTSRQIMARRLGAAFALLLLCGVAYFVSQAWGKGITQQDQSDSTPSARVLRVTTKQVDQAGPSSFAIRYTGVVSARRTSELAAKALGRVDRVLVDVGDEVVAGQVLVELDREQLLADRSIAEAATLGAKKRLEELRQGPRDQDIRQAELQVKEVQANLNLAEANLRRARALRESAAISAQELDESAFEVAAIKAQLESAQQALAQLQEGTRQEQIAAQEATVTGMEAQLTRIDVLLSDNQIVAPYAGRIQTRLVDEGEIVDPGMTVLELVEVGELEIRVGLPADVVQQLVAGEPTIIFNDQRIKAYVDRVSPAIFQNTRTQEVSLKVPRDTEWNPAVGSSVTVEIQRPIVSQGHWVPDTALTLGSRGLWALYVAVPESVGVANPSRSTSVSNQSRDAVYLVERRQVELLRSLNGWSEVKGPLSPDELLIVDGVHRVIGGQRVVSQSSESTNGAEEKEN